MKNKLLYVTFFIVVGFALNAQTPVSEQTVSPSQEQGSSVNQEAPVNNTEQPNTPTEQNISEQQNVTASAEPSSNMAPSSGSKQLNNALKKGNTLFNNKAFSDAIPYYEKALLIDPKNKMVLANLGDCYRLTNNVTGQIKCYGDLIEMGEAQPVHELYYGQALVENGENEKAKAHFEKYNVDTRGKELASSFDKSAQYKKNADAYTVTYLPYNSPQSDFCAVKFDNAVVFTSAREKTAWIKKQQGWTNGNYLGLYTTEKDENGKDYTPKPFMGDLDSKYNDGPICFTKTMETVYFTRNNSRKEEISKDGTFKLKILEAFLDENGFSMVKALGFNNNDYNCAHPSVTLDGYTLYFASDMEGGKGGMDIYRCKKDSSGVWGTPENMGDIINTPGNEIFPFIAANGSLYFSSNGHDGLGGLDIYEAKLKDGKASKIFNMGEPVNSKDDDFGIYLVEDCKSGFISSNRKAGGMDDDIYDLQILRDVKRGKEATIIVKDKTSGEALDSTKLVINGDTVLTNEKGEYLATLDDDVEHKIEAIRKDYFVAEDNMSSKSSLEETFTKELVIEKDPKLFLRGLITDAKTNELLEGVTVKIIDIETNSEIDNYITTAAGDYFKFLNGKKLGDKITYLIRLEKAGYLQRTVVYNHTIDKPGEVNMNESLSLTLGKVEVGMDLAKMIDIKPIYFDVGKSTIRKDAAAELDKIVQIMNEYPNMYIELGSHTDCRSSAESNLKLSSARAKASAAYIVKRGINKLRITGKGYGESKLLNNCACEGKVQSDCPEEEHMKNRRTEFLITRLK